MPVLADFESCTGCTACYNACAHDAIRMQADAEGFVFPNVNRDRCVECGLCTDRCPVLHPLRTGNADTPPVYALWSEKDRTASSSGGAFSAFARKVLAEKGMVWGAAFDGMLKCRHFRACNLNDLSALRGSKYVQSELGGSFSKIKKELQQGIRVLFCGTPCQVAGLYSYLHKDYENLLTLDLVCHGVPSDAVFQAYLSKLSKKKRIDIEGLEFRSLSGWGIATTVKLGNKSRLLYGYDNLYMQAFDKSALFRRSCYSCRYARLPRVGDCTIGDFWGIGRHGTPFRHDVSRGVSLVMANNAKGEKALSGLAGVFIERRTLEEALAENHNIIHPSVKHPQRDKIIRSFLDTSKSLGEIASVYGLVDKSVKGAVKDLMCRLNMYNVAKSVYNKLK